MGLVTRRNGRGSGYFAQGSSCLALDQAKPLMGRSRLEIMWQCVWEPQEALPETEGLVPVLLRGCSRRQERVSVLSKLTPPTRQILSLFLTLHTQELTYLCF